MGAGSLLQGDFSTTLGATRGPTVMLLAARVLSRVRSKRVPTTVGVTDHYLGFEIALTYKKNEG